MRMTNSNFKKMKLLEIEVKFSVSNAARNKIVFQKEVPVNIEGMNAASANTPDIVHKRKPLIKRVEDPEGKAELREDKVIAMGPLVDICLLNVLTDRGSILSSSETSKLKQFFIPLVCLLADKTTYGILCLRMKI